MTLVTQLSIFARNRPGELVKVTKVLAENGIQIRALTVAETADFGILRVIVDKPDKAAEVLTEKNILVGKTEILAVKMDDKPGGLNQIAEILGSANVNIEYLYAFAKASDAILLIQVSPNHMDNAIKVLSENKIKIYEPNEIYSL